MAASVFDSALFARLFPAGDAGRLFSDSAAIRAMLLTEGALAKAQGGLGIIPEISAAAIHRASLEIQIDPGELAAATGENGVSVPGLVTSFRAKMEAPEHAGYIHWGATSQDIIDTGLMLRLRQLLLLCESDLDLIIKRLAREAKAHAHTPMAARTYGQHATPTSWGAVLASWGHALLDLLEALPGLRTGTLWVSLSGAAGTASALGDQAPQIRAALAEAIGLRDPGRSWHVDRGPILRIADWLCALSGVFSQMGATLVSLTSSEIAEVRLGAAGASSTMPQKQNPVAPSALQALGQHQTGLRAALAPATQHVHQRDGAAWFTEWMVLPQVCLGAASALSITKALVEEMTPNTEQMAQNLDASNGLIHAEALSFALAQTMPRPDAAQTAKALCKQAITSRSSLETVARAAHSDLPKHLFDAQSQLGHAPAEALAFAARAEAL